MKTIFFTVCDRALYPFTEILKASLPANVDFRIGMVKEKHPDAVGLEEITNTKFSENYDNAALIAAAKPFFAEYFLKQAEQVVYFDPTVQIFGNLNSITDSLQFADIVLTPRLTQRFGQSAYGDEKLYLNSGMYDGGFWGLRRSDNTAKFLNWYQERLVDRAHFDLCEGQNHDQLWLNYVPILFSNVLLVKELGWNVALHNLHERVLTRSQNGWQVNQTQPLLFVNFREWLNPNRTVKGLIEKAGAMPLLKQYHQALSQHNVPKTAPFGLYAALTPPLPPWKQSLRQQLQQAIDFIEHYPLYHN